MKSKHWLAGVARILRAETDDLRELARMGGVDPRTAYIGTRLEGVDLRGQDLRGMLFSDLDLDHVRHDSETLVDPDQRSESANREAGPVFTATQSNDLPPYRDIEQALLEHLLEIGPVEPKNVYGPLADRFGLSESQRTTTRRDNSTPLWNNRVQWARRALNDRGYMAPRRGVWALTAEGLKAAGDFQGA